MSRLRIGIVGTGAIGGFYGSMLAKSGHDVHFLLRSDYRQVVQHGLQIHSSALGSSRLSPIQAYQHADDMPLCDWIFVAAKTTSNLELLPVIHQIAVPQAKVVLLQNGLGVEDALRPYLSDTLHLLGGLCFIYVHRGKQGVIEHQAMGNIHIGYHSGPVTQPEQGLALAQTAADWFKQLGLEASAVTDLATARWQKLVWNAPYNGLSVLLNSGTEALMHDAGTYSLIQDLMSEVIGAAAACGHPLPQDLIGKMLKNTQRLPNYLPSMYHDFQLKRPMELEAIYARTLNEAQKAQFPMPKTQMLLQSLSFLERRAQ